MRQLAIDRLRQLNRTHWFGVLALVSIGAITVTGVWLMAWFVSQRMLLLGGTLTREFVRSLLANAIEAVSHVGHIAVRGSREAGGAVVTLSVRDSGPDMSPQQLDRVGKPFYTTKPCGLGVGLSLARRIIERSSGRMDIESVMGLGTVVHLHMGVA